MAPLQYTKLRAVRDGFTASGLRSAG